MKNYKEYVITTDVSSMGAYCLTQTQLLINIKKADKKKTMVWYRTHYAVVD
jgi:hypothetical protein